MAIESILLIEDSEPDQFLVKCIIEDYDKEIQLHVASNGKEALDMLDDFDEVPSVILLDINMPIMDGHEFLRHYQMQPKLARVVIMLTSSMQNEDVEKSKMYSCVKKYVPKPFDLSHLLEIEKML